MQDATSGDFQGAIGAALAANDRTQAELWLRQALDRYPARPGDSLARRSLRAGSRRQSARRRLLSRRSGRHARGLAR